MRYSFNQLSVKEYDLIFTNDPILRRGGGMENINVYRSSRYYRRGAGLMSFVRGLGRQVLPFVSKYILPSIYNVGSNVLKDMSENNGSVKNSIKRRGLQGARDVVTKIVTPSTTTTPVQAPRKRKRKDSVKSYKMGVFK